MTMRAFLSSFLVLLPFVFSTKTQESSTSSNSLASEKEKFCPPTIESTLSSSLLDKDGRQRYRGRGRMPSKEDVLSELVWGQMNFLTTSDIHGWFQGHRSISYPEPNYSGDWADWIDFGTRMREKANELGVDLLLVDNGDLSDGNGLSDGFPHDEVHPVQGHVSSQIFHFARYDIGTIGNHELYRFEVAKDVYETFVPLWQGRYLTSNVNITLPDAKTGEPLSRPIGNRFFSFVTPNQNLSITAYGVMFDFRSFAQGVTVQPPSEMVKEDWFQESVRREVDLFLIAAHAPATLDSTFDTVYDAIRKYHPSTPIAMLGGHTHRRAARLFETNAMALEPGRYLETIGWMSIRGLSSKVSPINVKFSRKYIDVNLRNFAFHSGLKPAQMTTKLGKYVRHLMDSISDSWKLTQLHGIAPRDFYLDRVPFPHNDSLLSLLQDEVLPTVVRNVDNSSNLSGNQNESQSQNQNIILINSASQRFDVFSGPFLRNDRYIVSPFRDRFLVIKDVPWGIAKKVLHSLNSKEERPKVSEKERKESDSKKFSAGIIEDIFHSWLKSQSSFFNSFNSNGKENRDHSLGYQTRDSIDSEGDDTKHNPIPIFSDQPTFIASNPIPIPSSDEDLIDVIFVEFILNDIVEILNQESWSTKSTQRYSREDAKFWGDRCLTTQQIYPRYASLKWNQGKNENGVWDIEELERVRSGKDRMKESVGENQVGSKKGNLLEHFDL